YARIIEKSWSTVQPVRERLGTEFYFRMFKKNPAIAKMFRGTDMKNQSSRFTNMIGIIIKRLNTSQIIEVLQEVGHTHATYGVRPEMYDQVIPPFLESLELCLGYVGWTREVRMAWYWFMNLIQSNLSRGGHVRSPPPADIARYARE